jgi:hypothetical protein
MHTIPRRHELKYLLSEDAADALSRALPPFCERDAHTAGATDHQYVVSTLYFDTPGRALYWASRMEHPHRLKVRVRAYETGPVYLEVKRKARGFIQKSRAAIPRDRWPERLAGSMPGDATPAERDFRAQIDRHLLEPVVLVRYRREAWLGAFDDYARVTIDRQVECHPQSALSLDADTPRLWPIDDSRSMLGIRRGVVVELKASMAVPLWMARLVSRLELWRQSFSKYCVSLERTTGRRNPMRVPPTLPTYSSEV